MEETTISDIDRDILLVTLQRIDSRLARLEEIISRYEPLLVEAARRMSGPLAWKKGRQPIWPEK